LSQTPATETTQATESTTAPVDASAEMEQEINRLKELAARLRAENGQLQQLQTENVKLRAQIAASSESGLTAEDAESLAKAKERAGAIACVNNLKQFGLAVRIWASDNSDSNPPSVLSMSNELSTPKILVCPADVNRQVAADWASFTMANCSYEFLAPAEVADIEPQRVLSRCPIHGNIGLCDGSVQRVGKNHPDWFVERDGKLYFEPERNASVQVQQNSATPVSTPDSPGTLSEEQMNQFRRRYGIAPTNGAAPQ
jgi:hypothetical protein